MVFVEVGGEFVGDLEYIVECFDVFFEYYYVGVGSEGVGESVV